MKVYLISPDRTVTLCCATNLKMYVMSSSAWLVSLIFSEDQLPSGFPTIDMGPQLKVVERSRTATMLCAASGNPDPEITWFKDFLPVNTSNNNGRIKQLRSGNQCFYSSILSLPLNPSFYFHLFPSPLLLSPFQYPLPLIPPPPTHFLFSVPTKLLLFLPSFTPFLIAVPHSSCRGYWLCFSATPLCCCCGMSWLCVWLPTFLNSSRP